MSDGDATSDLSAETVIVVDGVTFLVSIHSLRTSAVRARRLESFESDCPNH